MTRFYSVVRVINPDDPNDEGVVVVCETLNDEKEIQRLAANAGKGVYIVVNSGTGIFLNDFPTN